MSNEGTALTEGNLDQAIAPIRAALAQGEAKANELRHQLDAQKEENQKARKVLALLDPEFKETKKVTKTGYFISKEKVAVVLDAIRKLDNQGRVITQPTVIGMTPLAQSRVSAAFRYLRSLEVIGRAGVEEGTGRDAYRLLDHDFTIDDVESTTSNNKKAAPKSREERLALVQSFIKNGDHSHLTLRSVNGHEHAFTMGGLMNAMNKVSYGGCNWQRPDGLKYVDALIQEGYLVSAGEAYGTKGFSAKQKFQFFVISPSLVKQEA